jgi:N-acetylmuramoyl-L-alanine amidase
VATAKGVCEYFGVKYVPEEPVKSKLMYRVMADGKFVVDTAYTSKIVDAVANAVEDGKKEISVTIRQ